MSGDMGSTSSIDAADAAALIAADHANPFGIQS